MEQELLRFFHQHPQQALLVSLIVSIVVAVLGVVPSVFVTGANILFFGFWPGTLVSFGGEAIGAVVAFLLYRKGFKKISQKALQKYPKAKRLTEASGKEAFFLILSLRLIPFVPSGLVTFAAAIGKASLLLFFAASSLGKLPALLMEAYAVYEVKAFGWQGKIILALTGCYLLYLLLKRK